MSGRTSGTDLQIEEAEIILSHVATISNRVEELTRPRIIKKEEAREVRSITFDDHHVEVERPPMWGLVRRSVRLGGDRV
jgi:hypothetical protein